MFEKRPDWARAKTAFDGKRYGIKSNWEGDGEVFSYDENRIVLKCRNEPSVSSQLYGFIHLPEFIVCNQNNSEEFRFRRCQRFLQPKFEIWTAGGCAGQIIQRNPICTNYELSLTDGTKWKLSLPLFTIGFFGSSSNGGRFVLA
jgi:hypothetical protein